MYLYHTESNEIQISDMTIPNLVCILYIYILHLYFIRVFTIYANN